MSSINKLKEHKDRIKDENIRTYIENAKYMDLITHHAQVGKKAQSIKYDPRYYCFTVRYIGLCVQFYMHNNRIVVQSGNLGSYKDNWPIARFIRALEDGRISFEKGMKH